MIDLCSIALIAFGGSSRARLGRLARIRSGSDEVRDLSKGGRNRSRSGSRWAWSNIDDRRSRFDGRVYGLQLLLFLDVEDHSFQIQRCNVLLLATAETGHRILADDSRSVIGAFRAFDVSFDPLGLVGRGRFNAGGELRQIPSFGT
jgi:hypothetical protein